MMNDICTSNSGYVRPPARVTTEMQDVDDPHESVCAVP